VVGEDSVFFSATLRDAQGRQLYGRIVTWTISDTSVARIVSSYGPYASFRPAKPGSAVITATSEGKSGTAQLVVIAPPPVASVAVTPPADTLVEGDGAGFLATPRDAQGNPLGHRSVSWTVGDPSVAQIEQTSGQSAQVRALHRGTTTVTATSEGKTGSAQLVVIAPPPVASVTVAPSADTLVVGNDSASFYATLRDAAGNVLSGRAVTWSVSDSSVVRIEFGGGQWVAIRALKSGSAVLTATSEGKSGTASVVVR